MRTSLFASGSALFILTMASCAPDSGTAPTPGTAGSSSTAGATGSGGSATGGTTGSGGDATGGTGNPGSGGDATGGTGNPGSGGSSTGGSGTGGSGTGGSGTGGSGTGGSAGASGGRGGSSNGGTGGSGTGGSAGASGGRGGSSNGGTGGSGAGGTAGASGGRGGSSGGGTGGTGGASGTAGTGGGSLLGIVGAFDGFLFTAPCGDGGTGYDCLNTGCTNGSPKTVMMDFAIGGTPGTNYDVTVNIKGVVEAKNYSGCTRTVTGALVFNANGGDLWCSGGTVPDSTYNSYEINVFSAATGGTAIGNYRLNARDGTSEAHQSWPLNETKTFRVVGGGRIQWRVYDSNCRQIMNCGPGTGSSTCAAPVTLSLASAMPPAPTSFMQPFRGTGTTANAYGQWVFIDVTNVVAAP